jgi:isocitrate dehydrogenase kinase/phosphatase
LPRYVSYLPDPNAEFVDAFSLKWIHINGFTFPSFSIVGKVVQKLIAEETELTLIAKMHLQIQH